MDFGECAWALVAVDWRRGLTQRVNAEVIELYVATNPHLRHAKQGVTLPNVSHENVFHEFVYVCVFGDPLEPSRITAPIALLSGVAPAPENPICGLG